MARRRRAALTDDLLDLAAHSLERDTQRLHGLRGHALTLVDETKENVLGTDVAVVQQASFFLRQHNHPTSPIGEAFKHG